MLEKLKIRGRILRAKERKSLILIFLFQVMFVFLVNFLAVLSDNFINANGTALIKTVFLLFSVFLSYVFWLVLRLGVKRYFYLTAKGEKERVRSIFFFFKGKLFFKALVFAFKKKMKSLINFMLSFLSFFVASFVIFLSLNSGVYTAVLIVFLVWSVLLFLCSLVCFLSLEGVYFLSEYLFFENTSVSFHKAEADSRQLMCKGAFLKLFMSLSFLPWFALCVLVLPSVFVWGYYNFTKAYFAVDKISLYRGVLTRDILSDTIEEEIIKEAESDGIRNNNTET